MDSSKKRARRNHSTDKQSLSGVLTNRCSKKYAANSQKKIYVEDAF